jgi:transcriptional regulator with XRE-family HTH domain
MEQGRTDIMTLKFAGKLDLFRRMKGWTIREMAEKVHISVDRMEYLLAGKHQPLAADIVRIMKYLGIRFEPEDFEGEGVPEASSI